MKETFKLEDIASEMNYLAQFIYNNVIQHYKNNI